MNKLLTFLFVLICNLLGAQSVFIDNLAYISLSSGGNIYVNDTSVSSIYSAGGGFYVTDTMGGFVEWNIQNNKGIYEVPFLSYSDVYLPIVLNITTAGTGSSIKFSNVDTPVTPYTSYYNANSINRYWTIDFSSFTIRPNGSVTLNYDVNDIPNNYSDLAVKYYSSSNIWSDIAVATYTNGSTTYPLGSYNSNKKWTLVNIATPLPVTLLFFKGENKENKYSHLTWGTALEINNSGFVVEKSLNAMDFDSIGWVDGHGNSTTLNTYSFDDVNVLNGKTYYYRLKQVDYDGGFEYSEIVSVKFGEEPEKIVYYNLVGQKVENIYDQSGGVYLKVVNGVATLIGIVK